MIDVEGQKFRVLLGTCPEEVEQWRAARRKLWPTNANIVRFVDPRRTTRNYAFTVFCADSGSAPMSIDCLFYLVRTTAGG